MLASATAELSADGEATDADNDGDQDMLKNFDKGRKKVGDACVGVGVSFRLGADFNASRIGFVKERLFCYI
jgi:hypothetical protein